MIRNTTFIKDELKQNTVSFTLRKLRDFFEELSPGASHIPRDLGDDIYPYMGAANTFESVINSIGDYCPDTFDSSIPLNDLVDSLKQKDEHIELSLLEALHKCIDILFLEEIEKDQEVVIFLKNRFYEGNKPAILRLKWGVRLELILGKLGGGKWPTDDKALCKKN